MMISKQAFLIAQLLPSLALSKKNGENLLEKNCLDTSFDMIGKCFIASFRTLTLESSPSDNISRPMNC